MRKKNENKVTWDGMPTSEAELKEIRAAIESTYEYYNAIAEAKEQLKDIFDDINARNGIPKKVFNFLAKANYKGNGYEQIQANSELEEAYEAIQKVSL